MVSLLWITTNLHIANNKQPIESAVHNVANKYIILPICNLHASYFTSISPPLCLSVDVVVSRPTVYKKCTIVLRFWYDKITGNIRSRCLTHIVSSLFSYCDKHNNCELSRLGHHCTARPPIAWNSQLITTIGFVNCNCIDLSPIGVLIHNMTIGLNQFPLSICRVCEMPILKLNIWKKDSLLFVSHLWDFAIVRFLLLFSSTGVYRAIS